MTTPAWLGIGAQRAGTTWFTDLLTQHPDVGLGTNGKKEQHLLHKVGDDVEPASVYLDLFPDDGIRRGDRGHRVEHARRVVRSHGLEAGL